MPGSYRVKRASGRQARVRPRWVWCGRVGCVAARGTAGRCGRDHGAGAVSGAPGDSRLYLGSAPPERVRQRSVQQDPMDRPTLTARRRRRVRRRAPLALAFLSAAVIVASLPSTALGWDNYSFSSASEQQMLTLINQARAANGKPAVQWSDNLGSVARWRSKDMWDRSYLSHDIPNPPGGNVFDELHRRGICYTTAGENIGVNNYPDDVATQTM